MPTSLGINPSLMIAANALRVADHIADEMAATNAAAERKGVSYATREL
jgi:choline dehydrogenase-like flavoprotein